MKIITEISQEDYAALSEEERTIVAVEAHAYNLLAGKRGLQIDASGNSSEAKAKQKAPA